MTDGEPRLTELALIRALRAGARRAPGVRVGIGDDCAVLELSGGGVLLATTDLLIEDVHFRRRYAEPADIGWKALAVNVSDIASMGGTPRWALVALACPDRTTMSDVEAFYQGVSAVSEAYGGTVVGGDTSASPAGWVVNITLLGEASRPPLLRSGARPGDVVAVTGDLGRSAGGLAVLERTVAPAGATAASLAALTSAHLRPRPRVKEGQWLASAGSVTAMIDLSDGLATDLRHVVEASNVAARVELRRLPIAAATREVAEATRDDAIAWATGGGEDYELLLTCAPAAFAGLRDSLLAATGTELTAVGTIEPGPASVTFIGADGRAVDVRPGFEHFAQGSRRE